MGVMLITIGIATLILVVDWTFLVLASRRTLQLTDTLALAAVSELIDEDRLGDLPHSQADDALAASTVILAPATGLLALNNEGLATQFRPTATQVAILPARVTDVTQPADGTNFTLTPGANRFNSLRVEVYRDPNGSNPLQVLMRGFGAPETAKITSSSIASLDSRVVGYRPRANTPSPVAPLAIHRTAWESTRLSSPLNSRIPIPRRELDVFLKFNNDPGSTANGALVNVDDSIAVNSLPTIADLDAQIVDGLLPIDLNPLTGLLGPFSVLGAGALYADDNSPATGDLNTLVTSFQDVSLSSDPRRVFLLYDTPAVLPGDLLITGFIAANVIEAEAVNGGMSGERLRVRLEPEAIVHFTAETMFTYPGANIVPENDYCHKIRLTR